MKAKELGEFGIIDRIAAVARSQDGVKLGIGDDAAVLGASPGKDLLATCDIQVEGVHFDLSVISFSQLGRRVAAVNLSDIAAMGGTPRYALVSLCLPADVSGENIDELYRGMVGLLDEHGACVVGGNTSGGPGRMVIDMTLLGEAPVGGALTRNGSRPGDLLCVTGALGGSAAGLFLSREPGRSCSEAARTRALERHLTPVPRVAEGVRLAGAGGVTSCMDVSDGLMQDAGHMARRSGVHLHVDPGLVPVDPAAEEIAGCREEALRMALCGGEDFELLFTVDPGHADAVIHLLGDAAGARVIGQVRGERSGGLVTGVKELVPGAGGFDHFR